MLTTALFAAPVLAAEHDYGHAHPEGTPEHVHTLDAVLGAGAESGGSDLSVTLSVQTAAPLPHVAPQSATPYASHHSRAPPTR